MDTQVSTMREFFSVEIDELGLPVINKMPKTASRLLSQLISDILLFGNGYLAEQSVATSLLAIT